jgi:hypothetical protein
MSPLIILAATLYAATLPLTGNGISCSVGRVIVENDRKHLTDEQSPGIPISMPASPGF